MRAALMLVLVAVSHAVLAHPEHADGGAAGAGLAHLLGEPDHLALLLLPVVIAGVLWRRWMRKPARARRTRSSSNI